MLPNAGTVAIQKPTVADFYDFDRLVRGCFACAVGAGFFEELGAPSKRVVIFKCAVRLSQHKKLVHPDGEHENGHD